MSEQMEQYKAYLQDIGNLGSRHENTRGFYLSVLSALIAFLALSGDKGPLSAIGAHLYRVVAIVGIAVCIFWIIQTLSFAAIFKVKLELLGRIEEGLPYKLFSVEYPKFRQDWRFFRLTYVECLLAGVLGSLFLVSILLK